MPDRACPAQHPPAAGVTDAGPVPVLGDAGSCSAPPARGPADPISSSRKVLKALDSTWSTMEFEHEPHPRTGTMLLKSDEVLVETLEDNQVQLQNLMTSKYLSHFLKEVTSWQQKLSTADAVISIWFEVQRTWSHLESIFVGSEDIRAQLPEDSQRFDHIDREFKVAAPRCAPLRPDRALLAETGPLTPRRPPLFPGLDGRCGEDPQRGGSHQQARPLRQAGGPEEEVGPTPVHAGGRCPCWPRRGSQRPAPGLTHPCPWGPPGHILLCRKPGLQRPNRTPPGPGTPGDAWGSGRQV